MYLINNIKELLMLAFSKLRSIIVVSLLFNTLSFAENTTIIESKNIIIPSALPSLKNARNFAKNEIIVTFKKGVSLFDATNLSNSSNITMKKFNNQFNDEIKKKFGEQNCKVKGYKNLGLMHLKAKNHSSEELIAYFRSDKMKQYVESVSKNNIIVPTTNDTYYNSLWALKNTGQTINNVRGTPNADINISEAWEKTKGMQSVIIAVLDTGIDYVHNDLQDNMWEGEAKHGYDFAGDNDGNNDDDPMPDTPYEQNGHYHGTHVAGIIGAVSDNNNGVVGVAQHISIMSLKVFRPNGYGYTSDVLEALEYISEHIDNGDNIVAINASYGGYDGSQDDPLNQAIKKLGEKGVLFCTAAGNETTNIDETPSYPASYNADNIIVVAASDQNDQLASFSNYGKNSVDIAAPGTNILSTYPDHSYAYMQGTSMATPYVSATIALIASLYGETTVKERKAMILNSVDTKNALTGKVNSEGRLNANSALDIEKAKDSTQTQEAQIIPLPIVAEGSNERKWETVNLDNGPIKFTTKENITMELRHNTLQKLVATISSNKRTSSLLLDIPNGNLQIDNRGNAVIGFEGKDISLEINSNGQMRSNLTNLSEAILPKETFPVGTNLDINEQRVEFTVPLSTTITF